MTQTLLIIPGDGIGIEVTAEACRVAQWLIDHRGIDLRMETRNMGMSALKTEGSLMPEATLSACRSADAILFGASGGPDFDALPRAIRRSGSVLRLRQELGLYVNLRPVKAFDALIGATPFKPEVVRGIDMMIVREANGGIYFGEPRGVTPLADGNRRGVNTEVYTTPEIVRIARAAFDLARTRKRRVCSAEKSNVLESSLLWREDVQALRDRDYPDIELSHMYVDNCAMQLVRWPAQFDVLLSTNLFGDILSDCAAPITGSLGMLPSASLNLSDESLRGASGSLRPRHALYEPVHGSAPEIAGRSVANPLGSILSLAMAFRHSLDAPEIADEVERAVDSALVAGHRTADIAVAGETAISTGAMGAAVIAALAA